MAGNLQSFCSDDAGSMRFRGFIGTSAVMQAVYEKIEKAAVSNVPLLITGESGTGKSVCAQAIHKLSNFYDRPFISIDCSFVTGSAQIANLPENATVFLREISELDLDLQVELLHSLKRRLSWNKNSDHAGPQKDFRVISSTRRNSPMEISKGLINPDLYYRLNVLNIEMPPLRVRQEDVLDIALAFLRQYAVEEKKKFLSFHEGVEFLLASYQWPGNIRELQNVIRNIVVMNDAKTVTSAMLPPMILNNKACSRSETGSSNKALSLVAGDVSCHPARLIKTLAEAERETIEYAISYCKGNITNAAVLLDVAPSTIYRKKAEWASPR